MKPARLLLPLLLVPANLAAAETPMQLERITVTADREIIRVQHGSRAVSVIDGREIDLVGASHPNEIFSRTPGTWISRGSGQEHLTAIRSPVLSGAGACGAFGYLEDGIPVRPAGFCNVNQLFEINTEMADSLEVLRGPGSVLYGSNALHGMINVLHSPLRLPLNEVAVSAGEFGQRRLTVDHADLTLYGSRRFKYLGETSDSIQRDAGFQQHKINFGWHGPFWRAHLAATSLDQDTAGYIEGENAYRDPVSARDNPNPEAFRRADSARAWGVIERSWGETHVTLRPFLRHSEMKFLQHYLPGKPLEENGQVSAGILAGFRFNAGNIDWHAGLDVEWAEGWLRETQADAINNGSDFLRETRPAGRHYDYTVSQWSASPWLNVEYSPRRNTWLTAGMRADWIRYDYRNHMDAGNAREDDTACGMGGCLFNRPADRHDTFAFASPKLGIRQRLSAHHFIYGNLLRGFRVPQATELYRLQRGQDVADLEPEYADTLEAGLRGNHDALEYDITAFAMYKRNVIFRDAEGFNVSAGRTRHYGVEFDTAWQVTDQWRIALNGSYARHRYAFDYRPNDGEQFIKGHDIDTAPRTLASLIASWQPGADTLVEAEYQHVGAYYLNAENSRRYSGHGLMHLRAQRTLGDWALRVRLNNLLDTAYAERADFAFGDHRYFPGWPRRVNVEAVYRF